MAVRALLVVALVACADQGSSPAGGRYQRVAGDIVRDEAAGLEWMARDNASEANWKEAELFCRDASRAPGDEWRLPTIDELARLYDPDSKASCGDTVCHLAAPIQLTSSYLWSASPGDSDRRFYFDFRFGTRLAPLLRPDLTRRVLCVRSRAG